mgnify:CR=1 FL=1
MKKSILLLTMIIGCIENDYIPYPIEERFIDCPWSMKQNILASDMYQAAYAETFLNNDYDGIEVPMNSVFVECKEGVSFTTVWVEDGREYDMYGFTQSRTLIEINTPESLMIGDSTFFHEMTHVTLWYLSNEPDPDHEEEKYSGWTKKHNEMIQNLQQEMRVIYGS